MTRNAISTAVAAMLLLGAGAAFGQRLTEMYIPIGQSPGLSGKRTVVGTISATDPKTRRITCAYGSETATMQITDRTRIWLDRSRAKLPSLTGALTDCIVGRRMEARYVNDERKPGGDVEWIKVEVTDTAAR
jgi:hypothetical protein